MTTPELLQLTHKCGHITTVHKYDDDINERIKLDISNSFCSVCQALKDNFQNYDI